MILQSIFFLQFILAIQFDSSNASCQTPDNQTGFCTLLKTCKTLQDFLGKQPRPISSEIKEFLKDFKCGTSGNRPKICCPPLAINFGQDNEKPEEPDKLDTFDFPDVSNHRNLNLIPKPCGEKREDTVMKVVNGNQTALNEFPWMALLLYDTINGPAFKCGGTIINEKYILTAAHCVTGLEGSREKLKLKGVRVGEYDTRTVKDCEPDDDEDCAPPVQDLNIEEVKFHKMYNLKTHHNDIAILRVSPSIDLSKDNAHSVCLPFGDLGNFNYTGRKVVVTGWGFTEKRVPSPVLLKAEIPLRPIKECQEIYESKRIAKIESTQVCAGGIGNSDSCGGDSGGPLHSLGILENKVKFIQQGIVSFGPADCGNYPLPGVYTRLAFYLDWILDNMKP